MEQPSQLLNFSSILQLSAAAITFGAAIYLARFRYNLIEDMKKLFILKPEQPEDWPMSRRENKILEEHAAREHARLDLEFTKVWDAISHLRRNNP